MREPEIRYYIKEMRSLEKFNLPNRSKAILFQAALELPFNFNGLVKEEFLEIAEIKKNHFARDIKPLTNAGALKVIGSYVFVNPRLVFYGSEQSRKYCIKCWDAGVAARRTGCDRT